MEQLLKIGENENVGGQVELSDFEKKLEFARWGFPGGTTAAQAPNSYGQHWFLVFCSVLCGNT